ncbi:MAG: U32 family peptidase [Oscillospiraceae bacterium]|nr:U32 family peptidase [Oscillospiraceae bacterium]
MPEILAPAGNIKNLKVAIDFGADAVYIGGSKLNLRAFADNFSDEDLKEAVDYAHERNRKVYVTLNVFPHEDDLNGLEDYLLNLEKINVDAIIVSDPGIIMTARDLVPNLNLHLSTQANNVNHKSAIFWYKNGIKRIVLAREMSFQEIKKLRENTPMDLELEVFVHGSMCMSYSGRCLLSNYMTGRDSNRGECTQPCRYKYTLVEEKRPGEYFDIIEDDRGSYILSSKDLCMIEHIPELMELSVSSFKIEGRMKSSFYVSTVVKAYREALDSYLENLKEYKFNKKWMDYLNMNSHREFFTGFYFGEDKKQTYYQESYIRNYEIVGIVKSYDPVNKIAKIEQRNKLFEGDKVGVLRPIGDVQYTTLKDLYNDLNEKINSTPNAQMEYYARTEIEVLPKDILFKQKA